MALAYIETFDNLDYGGYGRGAQCFDGYTSQDRVEVPNVTTLGADIGIRAFSNTPDLTVAEPTRYVHVVSGLPSYVYAGPASLSSAEKQARAVVLISEGDNFRRLVAVEPGHVVHWWTVRQDA